MKSKKRSLFLMAALLMVTTIPIYYLNFYAASKSHFDEDVEFRKRVLAGYLDLAVNLSETGQDERLERILSDGLKVHMYDWYLITYKGDPVLANPPEMANIKIPEINGSINDDEDKTCGTVQLKNSSFLTIGINKHWLTYLGKIKKQYFMSSLIENAIWILIALGIFAFLLKDILKFLFALKLGKGHEALKDLQSHPSMTSESHVFSEVMQGLQSSVDRLADEKEMFARQVLPSLRSELMSGQKPPYEFDCVMVRTDINRYSQMFLRGNRDVLMSVIHRFFTEATLIVTRYGGVMHEFIGDELIFYFKDSEHTNSVSMALSCLLEIQDAAKLYQDEINQAYQLPLTVKSSLAVGRLRYGPLVHGFAIMGPPLIESVRILSLIDERDRHQVFMQKNVVVRADSAFRFEAKSRTHLKGFETEVEIFELTHRKPLEELLSQLNPVTISQLEHYRKPQEIVQVLQRLSNEDSMSENDILKILGHYRNLPLNGVFPELAQALIDLVQHFRGTPKAEKITPTIINLMPTLINRSLYDESLKNFFQESLGLENERGISNTIEAFGQFEYLNLPELYDQYKASGSPRMIGNLLLLWGQRELTAKVSKLFRDRLNSTKPQIVASTLYAYAEVLKHWQKHDLVYLRANTEFIDLKDNVQTLASQKTYLSNESIQRQLQNVQNRLEKILSPTDLT